MNNASTGIFRIWATLVLTSGLAACSSMAEMAKQQDEYNSV
jgi:hypothetical protein